MADLPLAFTTEEAADLLRLEAETIRRAIRQGKLKAARQGRKFIISRLELEAYWRDHLGGGALFPSSTGSAGR